MKKANICDLTERCVHYFTENCYTANRIRKYKSLWRNGIELYLASKKLKIYSPTIGDEYIKNCHFNGLVRHEEQEKIRSVHVLNDMLTLGYIRKRCTNPVYHPLDGPIGFEMEKLIIHLQKIRRSKSTISDYRLYLSEFLFSLTIKGISSVNETSEQDILSFISSHPISKLNIVSALRVLFRFWTQEGVVKGGFPELFESIKVRTKKKIQSCFTEEEVLKAEKSISRSSPVGKRDYAMFLLASRLGIRASDIAALKLCNIDWDNNIIKIRMKKTAKAIELPLLADVGNAIIDYLRNGRPKTNIKQVFLSCRAPYLGATSLLVSGSISRAICGSGININNKRHGPHSLRHTLAGTLLRKNTTIPVISEVLGHKNTQTTMVYLKIDITSLQKCALPVAKVPIAFYMQRGGVFYE